MRILKLNILLAVTAVIFITGCKNNDEENKNLTSLEKLVMGNQRFLKEKSIHPNQNRKSILENQEKQKPFAIILTCSDSRVSPEIVFDQGIGDLFVIRNAGNLISDIDMGSVEYAVQHLDTKLIVILGHTECGAVKAYINDKNNSYKKHLNHIDNIVEMISKEDEEIEIDKVTPKAINYLGAINANIRHSTKLIEQNKIVQQYKAQVVSIQYDVHTGEIISL